MLVDIPFIHTNVRLEYVTNNEQTGLEEVYLFAVTCISGRPPLFTCHTKNGAVYSRLPLEAFTDNQNTNADKDLVPWTCLGEKAFVIKHEYLKDYEVLIPSLKMTGRYLFTIDYYDGNYSEDPEQHKSHNVIELEDGRYTAMPNNYCVFKDKHFTNKDLDYKHYRRQTTYWQAD